MQNEDWLNTPVYMLTRKQAFLVMCLVELVDGAEYYIDELQEKLGITGTEGYEGKDIEAINHADKHDRIRLFNDRWELHSEIQVATGGKPSFINGGLVDVTAMMLPLI
jgi:hypothetical protein